MKKSSKCVPAIFLRVCIPDVKNCITGYCNSRILIGLAIMGYDPLYHALQVW